MESCASNINDRRPSIFTRIVPTGGQFQKFVLDLSKLSKPIAAMKKYEIAASKLRFALQQIDAIPPESGVSFEHVTFVRRALTDYLKMVEKDCEIASNEDLNRVSRLVIEYGPISLLAGEAVIAAEQEMRGLVKK